MRWYCSFCGRTRVTEQVILLTCVCKREIEKEKERERVSTIGA